MLAFEITADSFLRHMVRFLAIPWLGLQRTLFLATGALIMSALLLTAFGRLSIRIRALLAFPAIALLVWLVFQPPWDRDLLASGVYKYAPFAGEQLDVETALKAGRLVYYRDGAAATVSVKRLTGTLSLSVDGKVDASTSGDMITQKTLAHLPLLLHGKPGRVCIIGLGSGVTLASALASSDLIGGRCGNLAGGGGRVAAFCC